MFFWIFFENFFCRTVFFWIHFFVKKKKKNTTFWKNSLKNGTIFWNVFSEKSKISRKNSCKTKKFFLWKTFCFLKSSWKLKKKFWIIFLKMTYFLENGIFFWKSSNFLEKNSEKVKNSFQEDTNFFWKNILKNNFFLGKWNFFWKIEKAFGKRKKNFLANFDWFEIWLPDLKCPSEQYP